MATATKTFKYSGPVNKFAPKKGERYHSINLQKLICAHNWRGDAKDAQRLAHNNVFPSFKAAQTTRKAMVEVFRNANSTYTI